IAFVKSHILGLPTLNLYHKSETIFSNAELTCVFSIPLFFSISPCSPFSLYILIHLYKVLLGTRLFLHISEIGVKPAMACRIQYIFFFKVYFTIFPPKKKPPYSLVLHC